MAFDPVERLNYYQFQYVGAEDFRDQQIYHRDMRRRHNLGPHSWGIVSGCTIVETPREADAGFVDIHVLPGVAVDGYGREIIILEPAKVDPELFAAFNTDRHLELWVRYDEVATRTATGGFVPCTDATAYSRVAESYRFLVGTIVPSRGDLTVGGDVAKPAATAAPGDPVEPADASIPYQDFPTDERAALWLVRLGSVHWDGTVRKFRPVATPDRLVEGRSYAGFVGSSVLAEGPALRLAPRVAPADADAADFAAIEGRLRVDGRIVAKRDLLMHGGQVSWQSTGGSDETRPLWMQRLAPPAGSGADLRIHIGDAATADTRLTIGSGPSPATLATEQVVLAVRADDRIDIPTGRLRLQGPPRQLIDLSVGNDAKIGPNGIGRHSGSVYFRSSGDHYWHRDGEHDDADGNPGAGGTQLMRLGGQGSLYFVNTFRQILNADVTGQSFGVGVQSQTLYQRSAGNFAWYRGGGHGSGEFDAGGGAIAMRLDTSSRLTVEGGIRSPSNVELWGSSLDFRTSSGGTDTDVIQLRRVNHGPDHNDLVVALGDNLGGDDRFVVGPDLGGNIAEQFVVENDGNVHIAGDLFVKNRKALIDVMSGEVLINQLAAGSGNRTVTITSQALANVSQVDVIVALSDIANVNVATDARWRVRIVNKSIIPPNSVQFDIAFQVDDIDGELITASYVAIFRP
jgi:hypothetical protein